jgi:hypothetical protein
MNLKRVSSPCVAQLCNRASQRYNELEYVNTRRALDMKDLLLQVVDECEEELQRRKLVNE